MKSHVALLFFSILVSSLFHPALSVGRCNSNDYNVLLKIKQAFGNPPRLASWQPETDCCNWYRIRCDEATNRVLEFSIDTGDATGQIPSDIGDLPFLQGLTIRDLSNVTGNIPRSITKLKHLSYLDLSSLSLTGSIPDFLSELPNLAFLHLSYNRFSGSIPSGLSKLTKLILLNLDRNQLTGSIPESFAHFKGNVPFLTLSRNRLTGTIPKSFVNIDFERIDLSRNKLTGDASMLFHPKNVAVNNVVDISRNKFEFDFSKVKMPTNYSRDVFRVVDWNLNHNMIYGGIPKGIVNVGDLLGLNVSYNRLCGEIPTGGDMGRFDSSAYIHNKCLCGPPLTPKC